MILPNLPQKSFIRKSLFILLSLIIVVRANAFEISGTVVSATTGKPIEFAGAYFSNTSVGMYTKENGSFMLNVKNPGIYQLVITHISYKTYTIELQVASDIQGLVIKLTEMPHELSTVIVRPNADREKYYQRFLKEFIGTSKNAENCKIENPMVINFLYDDKDGTLQAFADTFIVITNKALGYRIKCKLEYFKADANEVVFYGYPFFEDLTGKSNARKRMKIIDRRLTAYQGSEMHFFRSLYKDSLLQSHFVTYRLVEKPQPVYTKNFFFGDTIKYAPQKDSLERLGKKFLSKKNLERNVYADSGAITQDQKVELKKKGFTVNDMSKVPMDARISKSILSNPILVDTKKYYLSKTKDTIPLFSFVSDTTKQMKVLKFGKPFQIKYTGGVEEDNYILQAYFGFDQQAYARKLKAQTSFVIIKSGKLIFDVNGSYSNVDDFFMGAYMGWRKIADMLPIDYEPIVVK